MLDEDEDEMLYSDQELADMEGYQPEDGGLGRSGHPLPRRFTSVIFLEGGRGGGSHEWKSTSEYLLTVADSLHRRVLCGTGIASSSSTWKHSSAILYAGWPSCVVADFLSPSQHGPVTALARSVGAADLTRPLV